MTNYLKGKSSNYDKSPSVEVRGFDDQFMSGWENICSVVKGSIAKKAQKRFILPLSVMWECMMMKLFQHLKNG